MCICIKQISDHVWAVEIYKVLSRETLPPSAWDGHNEARLGFSLVLT